MLGRRAPQKVLVIPHQHRVNSRKAAATAAGWSVCHTLGRELPCVTAPLFGNAAGTTAFKNVQCHCLSVPALAFTAIYTCSPSKNLQLEQPH